MKDIVYFARYFIDMETMNADQCSAADLLYDGVVDVKDLSILAQMLSESLPQNEGLNTNGLICDSFSLYALHSMETEEQNSFTITVDNAVLDGDSVVLTASGSNCNGIAAMRFKIDAPEGFGVANVQACSILEQGTFTYNAESKIVTWYNATDVELNGNLFTVTLIKSGDAEMPVSLSLVYSEADFFSVRDYSEVPIVAELGTITLPPYISIADFSADGSTLTITLDTNMQSGVVLIAAFYQGERMVGANVQNVYLDKKKYVVSLPDVAGLNCKLFVLGSDGYTPLIGCENVFLI